MEADCFTGPLLDTLEELEISFNQLTTIPTNGIADLKVLRSLALVNNLIESVSEFSFCTFTIGFECKRAKINCAAWIFGLEGLKRLSLDKNHFEKIPTDAIASLAGKLEELSMGVNQIHEINDEALPLPKLKALSLDVNRLSRISGEVFKNTPNLLYLYLSNNVFSEIDPLMFQHIGQLKVLSMNYNMLSTLNKQTFQYAPSIVRLELANCFIGSIEEGTFWTIPKSQFISLANNKLRRVSQKVFASMPMTVALDMSNNMINEIEDFAFSGLTSLQMIDLSGNQLEKLPPNIFFNTFHADQVEEDRHQTNVVARVLNLHDNPWNCDLHLVWLVKWLKQNTNIQITSPATVQRGFYWLTILVSSRTYDPSSMSPTYSKSNKRPKPSPVISPHKWPSTTTIQPEVSLTNTMVTLSHSSVQKSGRFITLPSARRKLAVQSTTSQPRPAVIAKTNIAAMILVASLSLIGVIALLLITIRVIIKRTEDEQLKKNKKNQKPNLNTAHPIPRFQTTYPCSSSNYYADPSRRVGPPTTSTTHFYDDLQKDKTPIKRARFLSKSKTSIYRPAIDGLSSSYVEGRHVPLEINGQFPLLAATCPTYLGHHRIPMPLFSVENYTVRNASSLFNRYVKD
uniref:Uncharacterized protein n=1 Tax=Ditylenchus dipsaci TaxID=166011 RepID=A0A915EC50_9BILA